MLEENNLLGGTAICVPIKTNDGEWFIRFVVNEFSDRRISHSGRYERMMGSGTPKYHLAFVLEPHGHFVDMLNSSGKTEYEKLSEIKSQAFQILKNNDYDLLKYIIGEVSKDVGFDVDYRDVSYWVWLTPSLQYL